MNYPTNAIIDLDALMIALAHQKQSLPPALQHQLNEAGKAMAENQPDATQTLRNLIRTHDPLETSYKQVLQQWDKDYNAQERAKSLNNTFQLQPGLGLIFTQDIIIASDWVTAAKQLTHRNRTNSSQSNLSENFDRIAIMAAGGAFLGAALVQFLGGGPTQLIGAVIGAIFGILSGIYVSRPPRPRRNP
jgi:hypothetical protein